MIQLFPWDKDYETRVRIVCMEEDAGWSATFTAGGETRIRGTTVTFSGTFAGKDNDNNCGEDYVTARLSRGEWSIVPNGSNPEYNGTTDLQWYGTGIQR